MIVVNIISGFIIAVMTGLGIGSGGLFVIYLTLILGIEQLQAQGLNLMFYIFASGASMIFHLKRRNINLKRVCIMAASGIIGALIGTYISAILHPDLIKKCFGILLLLSGVISMIKK